MQEGFIPADRMVTDVPEFQDYRLLSERTLEHVRSYNGTEDSYNDIANLLIELEKKALSLTLAPTLPIQKQERVTADMLLPRVDGEGLDIDSLLDIATAADSVRRIIHDALRDRRNESQGSPLYIRRSEGVILPPVDHPRVMQGNGAFDLVRFEERLFELTRLLRRGKIFLDDCLLLLDCSYHLKCDS